MRNNKLSFLGTICLMFFLFLFLPASSYSSGLIYTIQTGSFLDASDAQRQFDFLSQELNEDELDYLRIENIGQFYSVRIGKFTGYSVAEDFRMSIKPKVADATTVEAYIKMERIVDSYKNSFSDEEPGVDEETPSVSLPEETEPPIAETAHEEEQPFAETAVDTDDRISFTDNISKLASLIDKNNFSNPHSEPVYEASDTGIEAITLPSADVNLSFIQPGRIEKVHVKEGDLVKKYQIIIQQDSAAEKALLSMIREQSTDTTQIEAQKANLAQKREYLKSLEWAAARGSATEAEVEDAKLEATIAEFSLKTAEFDQEQNKKKYKEAKIRVDNMSLKSPIAGKVDKVEVEVGESIDGLANVVRVVRINPLWIDVHVPLEKSSTLRLDQTAKVIFPGDEKTVSTGKIIFISTVADAASATLRVRIEVPNESNRPAGQHVEVLFSTPNMMTNNGESNNEYVGEL